MGSPDIVHAPAEYGCFFGRRGARMVLTLHGYNLDAAFRPYASIIQKIHYSTDLRYFMRRSLAMADAVVAVSEAVASLAYDDLGLGTRPRVIPNGVDTARFRPAVVQERSGETRVLFAGNPSRRKGGDLLIEIASKLSPGIRLVCAGGLRGERPPFAMHERIEWLGPVTHDMMPELYRSVDMLLMPSVREGMSLSALEAMASGLPLVSSNASSFPELIGANEGGYLCEVRNPEGFADRINYLAEQPQVCADMGQRNRAHAIKYHDVRVMAAAYQQLFQSLP